MIKKKSKREIYTKVTVQLLMHISCEQDVEYDVHKNTSSIKEKRTVKCQILSSLLRIKHLLISASDFIHIYFHSRYYKDTLMIYCSIYFNIIDVYKFLMVITIN